MTCSEDFTSYGYTYHDALNSGCFDTALHELIFICNIENAEEGLENQCYACPLQCTELTSENGCDNDQCMPCNFFCFVFCLFETNENYAHTI